MNAVTKIDPAAQTDFNDSTALPLRTHTLFGVCEAIGEDFGINPLWLRIPLATSVLVSPTWAIVTYLALGVAVLASRLISPDRKSVAERPVVSSIAANSETELPIAA